jgi:hypothetical protein
MEIPMAITQEQEKIKFYISSFVDEGLNEQSAKSLLIKLYVLSKHNYLKTFNLNKGKINLLQILENQDTFLVPIIKKLEIFQVCDFPIPLILIRDLRDISICISTSLFFSYIKDSKSSKSEGQFFTPINIINQIYSGLGLFKERMKQEFTNVLDCSAGLGDFLSVHIQNEKILNYAVELDELTFEFMIFNFFLDKSISQTNRTKLILTLKQGDALKGYQTESVDSFTQTDKGKNLLLEYRKIREILLKSDNISIKDLERVLDLRYQISNFQDDFRNFNWFIDFPEIFFNRKLQLRTENVFDFVLGNPPWIKFGSFNMSDYSDVFSHSIFADQLQGKFNFSLPFIILGYKFTKNKGALVIPKGIVSETYASKWREKIVKDKTLSKLILSTSTGFKDVMNEYGLIFWDKEQKKEFFQVHEEKSDRKMEVDFNSLKSPLFKIPLIPRDIYQSLEEIFEKSQPLKNFCEIRRGLTLSKKYQEFYFNKNLKTFSGNKVKKLIRHNYFTDNRKEGVRDFQVFYDGEQFVYDKELLGAPGTSSIFERHKIIRRNRGKQWLIGLDFSEGYFVNDIFDIIYTSDKKTLLMTFGYLSSTLVQFLMETCIQRDITSNQLRELPFPNLGEEDKRKIETAVNHWIDSTKNKKDIQKLKRSIDEIVFRIYNIPNEIIEYIKENTKLHWSS